MEIGETTDFVDVNRLMDVLQPFKDRCMLLHGVGQWTQGHKISVHSLNRQNPQFFESKEIKGLIRKLGFTTFSR